MICKTCGYISTFLAGMGECGICFAITDYNNKNFPSGMVEKWSLKEELIFLSKMLFYGFKNIFSQKSGAMSLSFALSKWKIIRGVNMDRMFTIGVGALLIIATIALFDQGMTKREYIRSGYTYKQIEHKTYEMGWSK